jgi:hypothetical protein
MQLYRLNDQWQATGLAIEISWVQFSLKVESKISGFYLKTTEASETLNWTLVATKFNGPNYVCMSGNRSYFTELGYRITFLVEQNMCHSEMKKINDLNLVENFTTTLFYRNQVAWWTPVKMMCQKEISHLLWLKTARMSKLFFFFS